MAAKEITYDPEQLGFLVDGDPAVLICRNDQIVAATEAVADAKVASLERALTEQADTDGSVDTIYLSDVPADEFDHKHRLAAGCNAR